MRKLNKFDLLDKMKTQTLKDAKDSVKRMIWSSDWLQELDISDLRYLHNLPMKQDGLDAETFEELDFIEKNRANIRKIISNRKETIRNYTL